MQDGNYILRKGPDQGGNIYDLDSFIDRMWPECQEDTDTTCSDEEQDDKAVDKEKEWEVEEVIGKRRWHGNQNHPGGTYYTVRWVGGGISEVLEEDMHCKEKVAQYELGIAEHTHIALLAALSDTERAVRELIRRNDLTGEVSEWIEAYESEVKQVSDKRFIEVTGEERDRVIREGLAMKLKMLLHVKKSGRKKGRLVGQGFVEPGWLTAGKEDSPVASLSSVRTILFTGGSSDDAIGSIDVTGAFLLSDEYTPDDPDTCMQHGGNINVLG